MPDIPGAPELDKFAPIDGRLQWPPRVEAERLADEVAAPAFAPASAATAS